MEYRTQGVSGPGPIILLLLEDAKDGLRFLVSPDWRSIVQPEDLEYMDSLLLDFLERTKEQPATLFKQLSSLGVGPLVTQETGERISDHKPILELCSRFVQL